MSIKLSIENLKLVILLVLFPFFIFSVSVALKAIYAVEEFTSPIYAEDNLRRLKILNSISPNETVAALRVEIVDTPDERALGLSGRKSLPANRGMLFVFSDPDYYNFWMKDMNFSLDFVWINGDEIVEITRNVKPEDYQPPKVLNPKNEVNKVLELNAGAAERLGIKAGDRIEID